jgi:hypothetical protein
MTSLSFLECCQLFAVDPKTLRQWLAQAEMSVHAHPTDAPITCLSHEQIQTLARLHGRAFGQGVEAAGTSPQREGAENGMSPTALSDADLRARLVQMEAQMATLQAQLTTLTLQLRA